MAPLNAAMMTSVPYVVELMIAILAAIAGDMLIQACAQLLLRLAAAPCCRALLPRIGREERGAQAAGGVGQVSPLVPCARASGPRPPPTTRLARRLPRHRTACPW